MQGWVKLHRSTKQWEWYDDHNITRLFFHILMSCNHSPKRWKGIDIVPGQLVTGRHELCLQVGLSEQSIRTSLTKLKSTNELTIKTTKHYSLITVVKWDEYQGNQPTEQPPTNQLGNHPLTTTKERKKEKKEEVAFATPPSVSVETWEAWMEVRRLKKCKFTDQAYKMIVKDLAAWFLEGYNLDKIIATAVKGNWSSLYAKPEHKRAKQLDPRIKAMRGG